MPAVRAKWLTQFELDCTLCALLTVLMSCRWKSLWMEKRSEIDTFVRTMGDSGIGMDDKIEALCEEMEVRNPL